MNAEAKHTPGPWEAGGITRDRFVLPGGDDGEGIFEMGDVNIFPPTGHAGPVAIAAGEANARLIAAAPDMLEALWWLVSLKDNRPGDYEEQKPRAWAAARAAIIKATDR
jgi:hypothetical protein